MVYDTSTQPFSVGDFIVLQEASLVVCEAHGLSRVDVAILYDPSNPGSSNPVFTSHVTHENVFYHLATLLPVAQVNPKLASLLLFDSRRHFESYATDNVDRYVIWPSGWQIATRESVTLAAFRNLFDDRKTGRRALPHLSCRPHLKRWAEAFYAAHAGGRVPVTVNLRNNPGWHQERNSRFDAWLAFFSHCDGRYPAVFVVLCSRSEIDARLRDCPNVVVAKDHGTGLEQDLALIHTSALHMGANSGPATMAWFNDKPYLMVNTLLRDGPMTLEPGMAVDVSPGKERFRFSSPLQHAVNAAETKELLVEEFERMWAAVDGSRWESSALDRSCRPTELKTWLR